MKGLNKNMEKITKENIEKEYPNNLRNNNLIKKRGLENKYFDLLNKYNKFLTSFLKEKLPLEQIDENMGKSELDFVRIEENDMDFYQITSTIELNYIYLRNNIYIEKLNDDDIKYLEKKKEYDEEVSTFINRTFKNVINPYNDSKMTFYGPENRNFMCDSDELVLGIRYDEFNTKLEDEEFKENFLKKQEIISQLTLVLGIVALQELNCNINVIQYNEISIMNKYKENDYAK